MKKDVDYGRYMPIYGVMSLLFVLEYFEKLENFEECQKIVNAIHEKNHTLSLNLPKLLTTETVTTSVLESLKEFDLVGSGLLDRSREYAKIILTEIK